MSSPAPLNLPGTAAGSAALHNSPDAPQGDLPTRLSELVRTAAQGNPRAFEEFYRLTTRMAFFGVLRMVGHNHADDPLHRRVTAEFDMERNAWVATPASGGYPVSRP